MIPIRRSCRVYKQSLSQSPMLLSNLLFAQTDDHDAQYVHSINEYADQFRKSDTTEDPTNIYGYKGIDVHKFTWKQPSKITLRSPCPFINTLANHNILPFNGTDIPIQQLFEAVHHTSQASARVVKILTDFAKKLGRTVKGVPVISLNELGLHSNKEHDAIEHDASLTRLDANNDKYRAIPVNPTLVAQLLKFAEDDELTLHQIIKARKLRLLQHRSDKMVEKMVIKDYFVMHGETVLLANVMGRDDKISVAFAKEFLLNERFPAAWEKRVVQIGILELLKNVIYVAIQRPSLNSTELAYGGLK
eukprot:NODE_443_length_7346_cov_1.066648.p3 type:complete len:304 gc:universal NODE_443_length_7346_cov_1.066648:2349-1438(-)